MSTIATDAVLRDPPAFDWDPWEIENLIDPYPMHEAMRELAPVVWLSKYQMYATARHEEAAQVLADYSRFMTGAGVGMQDIRKPGDYRIPSRLQEVDPPKHTQVRSVVTKVMSPIVIRKMREAFVETAEAMAREIIAKGEFDGVADLAEPYVISVFAPAVGVRLRRTEALAIAEMRFNQSCPHNEIYHRAMAKAKPYLEWFDKACQRESVVPGSLADQLFDAEERGELEEGVASNIMRSFVGGGVDSTISGLTHTLHHLARNPDQLELVRKDPRNIRQAFEEGIRLDTPFQFTWRTTTGDVELSGYRLKGDTKVTVLLGAANRDPRKWEDPERYDLTRTNAGNFLGFGVGDHACIGQMIARFEAEAILGALLRDARSLELTGEPTVRPVNQMRMLGSLPLRITV